MPALSPQNDTNTPKPRRLKPLLIATAVVTALVAGLGTLDFNAINRPHYDWRVAAHAFIAWAWLAAGSCAGVWYAIKVSPRTPRWFQSISCFVSLWGAICALLISVVHAGLSGSPIGRTITEGAVQLRPVRDLGFYAIEIRVKQADLKWSADYNIRTDAWLIPTPPTTPWNASPLHHADRFPLRGNIERYAKWFEEHNYPKAAANFEQEAQELKEFTADQWQLGSFKTPLTSFTPDWFDRREYLWIPRRSILWAQPFLAGLGFFTCAFYFIFWPRKPPTLKPIAP